MIVSENVGIGQWDAILTLATKGIEVGAAAQARKAQLKAEAAEDLPAVAPMRIPIQAPAQPMSYLPYAIIGGVVLLGGLGIVILMRPK